MSRTARRSLTRQAADLLLEEARARAAIGDSAPALDPTDVAYLLTATAAVVATAGRTPPPTPAPAPVRQDAGAAEHPVDLRDAAGNPQFWLTTEEIQRVTGVSTREVLDALRTGDLVGTQRTKGGKWRAHRDAVAAWLGAAR